MDEYHIPKERGCQIPGITKIYMDVLGYKKDGSYAEVGAFDGLSWTNTECFAQAGWRGLLVEPQVSLCQACVRNYAQFPKVVVENCGCGKEDGELTLYGDGSLATTDFGTVEKYRKEAWSAPFFPGDVKETKIPMFTLDALLQKYGFGKLDVLVVDTEGTELDVLHGFSIGKYKPTIAIIECVATHKLLGEKAPLIDKLMSDNGYRILHSDSTNTVYVLEQS
jgi:FkbM family methyltransferase